MITIALVHGHGCPIHTTFWSLTHAMGSRRLFVWVRSDLNYLSAEANLGETLLSIICYFHMVLYEIWDIRHIICLFWIPIILLYIFCVFFFSVFLVEVGTGMNRSWMLTFLINLTNCFRQYCMHIWRRTTNLINKFVGDRFHIRPTVW